jgi:pimeloyl-ACP methyl ester carboxylesterase
VVYANSALTKVAEVDGLNVAYLSAGDGDAVLLVHGWPTHSYLWRRQLPVLAERFRVYALDLPGFGASDKPSDVQYTLEFYTGILTGFLDAVDVRQVRIVCHDLGGPISLLWAARHPERVAQLVVLDTTPYPDLPIMVRLMLPAARLPGVGNAIVSRSGLRFLLRVGTAGKGVVTDELVAAYDGPYANEPAARRVLLRILAQLKADELRSVAKGLGQVTAPTLILWAEKDASAPVSIARRMQTDIRGAVLNTIPDCGHFVTEDQPNAVNERLLEFLE